jgi:hypothetical protein
VKLVISEEMRLLKAPWRGGGTTMAVADRTEAPLGRRVGEEEDFFFEGVAENGLEGNSG